MKKGLAMLLTVCMALTMLPVSALAARSSQGDRPMAETAMGEEVYQQTDTPASPVDARLAAAEDGLADGEITDSNRPGAFIQARGDQATRYFTNLKYALDAAADGDTVVLKMGSKTFAEVMGSDEEYVVRQSDLTIDLGGNTVNDVPNYKLILAGQGITLQRGTLNGADTTDSLATTGKVSYVLVTNGNNTKLNDLTTLGGISVSGGSATLTEVNATGTNYYAVCAQVGADVTIESGTYQKLGLAEGQGYQANSVLWVESDSTMVVNGGTFTAAEGGNIVLKGHSAPTISGGTFNRDMTAENATLAEGFEQKQENGSWTVTEKPKPEVGPAAKEEGYPYTEYNTLQEAINAAEENSTICHNIYLLRNVTENVTVDGNRTVQIGLGNSSKENYTLTTAITVKSGSFLRLADYNYGTKATDTATWAAKHGDAPIVTVEAGGEFELSQGGMKGTGAVIQNNGGTVTLAQESWLDGTVTGSVARIAYDAKLSETAKNSIGEISGKEWLDTAAPGKNEGNWYISGTAAIEVGSKKYGSGDLQLAIDQAEENETVKLLSSVTASVTVGADKKIILDLNGMTLTGAKPSVKNQDPTLKNLGTLTITGNGTVKHNTNSRFDGDTVVNEGTLTIESGKFQTKSGHVSLKNNADKAKVTVKNGTFAEDISAIATPGEGLEFAEGGKGVVKAKVAQITKDGTVTKYETLQEAVEAAGEGDTVKVLKDVTLTKSINPGNAVTIEGVTKADGSKPVISGNKGLFSVTKGNATLKNLELQATGETWYIYQETELTVDGCDFTMAEGVTNVGNLIMDDGHGKVTFTNNNVRAHSRVALAGPGNDSVITNNVFDLVDEHYGTSRASVIGLVATEASGPIVITGNTFKNANRVLGVDNSYANVAENLTFKDNAFIDCRWAFELDPTAQSGFDLSENYYCFDGAVGVLRVENAASSGSHFEFGNETGTEYVLTDTNNAVEVNSYYTDEEMTDLVEFAAQVIAVADGAVTSYATVAEALAASNPGDTLKLLAQPEGALTIPDDKAVQVDKNGFTVEIDSQAMASNTGSNKFYLYGGLEACVEGELAVRGPETTGSAYGGYSDFTLYKDVALTGDLVLPRRGASTCCIIVDAKDQDKAVSIDLAGHSISQHTSADIGGLFPGLDGRSAIVVRDGSHVTVVGKGTITGGANAVQISENASFTLKEATINTKGSSYTYENGTTAYGAAVNLYGGEFKMEGGVLDAPTNASYGTLWAHDSCKLTISGGTVTTGANGLAIVQGDTEVTYNVTGGTFTSDVSGCLDAAKYCQNKDTYEVGEHVEAVDQAVEATCTTEGKTAGKHCSVCNAILAAQETIPATGHNHNGVVEYKAATCTQPGVTGGTYCTNCGAGRDEALAPIPTLGEHNWTWAFDETNHWHECADCGEKDETETPAAHTWVLGTPSGGSRTDTCECGAERTVSVSSGGGSRPSTPQPQPPEEDLNEPDVPLVEKPFLFTDVTANDWFYDAVKYVSGASIMVGVNQEGTLFGPGLNTTRATVATIIYRMENKPAAAAASFDDVPAGMWYSDAVNWTDQSGVMIGFGDGTFGPGVNVTREQLVTVLYRYAKRLGMDVTADGGLSAYADAGEVSSWAEDAMAWAVRAGLIQGRNGTHLAPGGSASRSELAAILQRFQKLTADADAED